MTKNLTKSLETYLMAIDELLSKNEKIIVKDVAQYLNFGGASTADAIKKLKEKELVNYEPYGDITLTSKGKEVVSLKKYRHNTIVKFLNAVLCIDLELAKDNANAIEYSMSENVLAKLVAFMDFMDQCTCQEPKWISSCKKTLNSGAMPEGCQTCKSKNSSCDCCNCKNN